MKQFKYISSISENELNEGVVHPCINEDGFRCILIKNSVEKTVISKYETDNLGIRMNTVLSFNNTDYYFHIITSKKNDKESNNEFELIYDYIFRRINTPVLDSDLTSLVLSLEEYFRITPERNNKTLQIGVWGELFCLKWIYNHGFPQIIQMYHNNFYLKHDVEFSKILRMEIKTTVDQKRVHHFRHDQICRTDLKVLVASLVVEEAQKGTSLFELYSQVLDLITNAEDRFALQKTIKLCGVSDSNKGMTFAEEKAGEDIRFYLADSLPQLSIDIPQGISRIEYCVDCELGKPLDHTNLIKMLNEGLINNQNDENEQE